MKSAAREVNQQVTLDGVIATEPRIHTVVFTPSIDAIEEFKVQTSPCKRRRSGGCGCRCGSFSSG